MNLSNKGYKSQIAIIARHYMGLLPKNIDPFLRRSYSIRRSLIRDYEVWDVEQQRKFVFQNIKQNVECAYSKIPFYRDYYDRNNFKPSYLRTFDDIRHIPVINKSILLEYPTEKRCSLVKGAVKVNTGGSSGHTLAFFIDSLSMEVNEKIHMMVIWSKLGFKDSDLKLVLIGQNKVKDGIDFCFRSNSVRLDTYKEFGQLAPKLKKIARSVPIRFLQGYPSIIYEFALYCENYDQELKDIMQKSLKGAFLGSEYPHPVYRDKIENVFGIDSVNWYGHTEGAVLAYEKKEKFRYYPFQTYGFAEITDEGHLMASTYYNKVSPFIRYDTEDSISDAETNNGFLISFSINEGRSGEYIVDKNGKKISLTALIFGRHHRLFDYCSHIQIGQKINGQAIVIYVPKEENMDFSPNALFDGDNIEMEFSFERRNNPIKTTSGKLNLFIKPEQLKE